ncbi:MAG: hypothetical protein ACFFBP_13245 [Promethearchaeota archaeon]
MKKSNLIKVTVIFWIFTSLFMINFFNRIDFSRAASNGGSLSIKTNALPMKESSKCQGKIENTSSIDILLPSSGWNVTNVELNFTNIRIEKEIKTVEDQQGPPETLYYFGLPNSQVALNVQLNITEETTIYGVYIYGNTYLGASINDLTFQIKGYNIGTFKPSSTIWGSIDLNMSSDSGWYLQDFSTNPITLPIGNYALVINGTERSYSPSDGYILDWHHNGAQEPLTPNLHHGGYEPQPPADWTVIENQTLLHKLVQKVDKTYNPEEINMSAIFNGKNYKITNQLGGGNVSFQCNNMLISNLLEIQVKDNRSIILNFTIDYSISLKRISTLESTILVQESFDNSWNIEFSTNKNSYNYYHIELNFSYFNWFNIIIYKEGVNITTPSILNEINKIITLSNNTINEGITNWRITANSLKIDLLLDFPSALLNLEAGQSLRFTLYPPPGDITVILVDSLGYEEYRNETENFLGDYVFNHLIPSKTEPGIWNLYIYWNNNTDAGFTSQEFTVFVPFTIDPQMIINVLIIIAIISIISISTYQTAKFTKNHYDEKKRSLLNTVTDILNIKYFMITEKNSGLNIYEEKIGKGKQDSMLISGYLDAISKFEIALTDSENRSQSIKLEYQDSKILMSEFKSFRIILIMKQNPSKYILNSIEKLSYDIDREYGEYFTNFTGELKNFKGIDNLIEKHLHISLIYPHKIVYRNIEELKKAERKMIQKATNIIKTTPHFYILFLIPENEWKYRNFKTILKLINKKVFQPITPNERQKKIL